MLMGFSGLALADCHQTHACAERFGLHDPSCEAAKGVANQACDGCIASRAFVLGLTSGCVACVAANFSVAAAGAPVCIKICGSAVAVERVAHEAKCSIF
jgi:hypothetical protein